MGCGLRPFNKLRKCRLQILKLLRLEWQITRLTDSFTPKKKMWESQKVYQGTPKRRNHIMRHRQSRDGKLVQIMVPGQTACRYVASSDWQINGEFLSTLQFIFGFPGEILVRLSNYKLFKKVTVYFTSGAFSVVVSVIPIPWKLGHYEVLSDANS
jgi:hypothetical protein